MKNSKILFNDNWLFTKQAGTTMDKVPETALWQDVSIPHDWLIYDTKNLYEDSTGFYKKKFNINKNGQLYFLRFDGVYMDCSVFINRNFTGDWKYGYTSFEFDITNFLVDGENEIIVRVVYKNPNSRWYTGAGIYRNVWLKTVNPVFIASDGIYITPRKLHDNKWEVTVNTEVAGNTGILEISHEITDPKGKLAASYKGKFEEVKIIVESPELWDITSPNIYTLVSKLYNGNEIIHEETNTFGFRTILFDPDRGFFLNGKRRKIQGVCQHHDLGCLGAAVNRSALRRQMILLKEMGANGIRTSHNPPDPALMELADEMGFLVVSEILDMWERPKTKNDYARFFNEWIEKDMASWLRRDRNHPSLIMWTIGNEIYDTHADPKRGSEIIRLLMDLVKKHDPKGHAPITIASNQLPWENTQKCADLIKLVGYNYGEYLYADHHKKYPDWVIYGSETASVVQSRGIYHFPLSQSVLADDDEQCSSLGNSAVSYGAKSAEACILADRDVEFSPGQFIWSGTDYIGEPTPYHTKNSYYGQIDTAGFKKDSFYVYQSAWTDYKTSPMIHIFPYWDFSPGQMIDVRLTSNAPKVELFFNGNSLGTFNIDHKNGRKIIGDWQIPYERGVLKALAYDENGKVIAECVKSSFTEASEIIFICDKTEIKADGEDLIFVEIYTVDKNGITVENANNRINIKVEGAGFLVGLDNGDAADYDQYKGTSKRLFSGKLLAVLAAGSAGEIKLTAASKGLVSKTIVLNAVTAESKKGISAVFIPNKESLPNHEVPIRNIRLTSTVGNKLDSDNTATVITAEILPNNAAYKDLQWRLTDAAGIDSNLAVLEVKDAECKKVLLSAKGNGKVYVRCSSKNGRDKTSLISCLDFEITGLGNVYLNPYDFIAGGLYNRSNAEMTNGNERGVATLRDGTSHVGFEGVDFGAVGADEITLPVFAMTEEPLSIEVWEGMLEEKNSEKITTLTYTSGTQWNTYIEETYKLPRRLKGITTICFVVYRKIHIKGFSFKKIPKAYEQINAIEYSSIYGDAFTVTKETIEGIGNNVTIEFDGMDFSAKAAARLQICGRTSLDMNTIQLKFDDSEKVYMLDFKYSAKYSVQEFDLQNMVCKEKIRFIFLPGCDFDFKWFRFVK